MYTIATRVSDLLHSRCAFQRRPFSPLGFVLLVLFWMLAVPAQALEGKLTLEGCRSDGSPYPATGPFVCDDGDYTTGNLGKNWDELDNVPFRLTIESGQAAIHDTVAVVVDREDASRPGFDRISDLTLVPGSSAACASTIAVQTVPVQPGVGGIDVSIFRTIEYSQPANLTCVYDFYARLAFGSHLFPGASLHANLAQLSFVNGNPVLSTTGVGARDVSIPVNELTPPEVDASISAVGDSDNTWTLEKKADTSELDFGDVCEAPSTGDLKGQVKFDVKWTKVAVPGGAVSINVKVTATSFASRDLEVQAKGTIVASATGGQLAVVGDKVSLPANANQHVILDKTVAGSSLVPGGAGGVGDVVSFNNITVSFFDPDDSGVLLGTTAPFNVSTFISQGTAANSTATVSDTETIDALPEALKFSSTQFPSVGDYQDGYVEGAATKGPVDWISDPQSGAGAVQFTSDVFLGERRIIDGLELKNSASLLASDGYAPAPVNVTVQLKSSATVKLGIQKKITVTPADFVQPGQSIKVKYTITGALGYEKDVEIVFAAAEIDANGTATKSLPALTGLVPDAYTVTETGSFLVDGAVETAIALNDAYGQQRTVTLLPVDGVMKACAGTAKFDNVFTPVLPRAEVMKVTVPTSPEGGNGSPWSFTLTGPDGSILATITDHANDGNGSDFGVDLSKAGTYTVTETPQAGWDLTDVQPSLPASPQVCTFTVSFPADMGAKKSCTFTNTKRGKVKVVKTVNGGPVGSFSFSFQVRQGASTTTAGTTLASGVANTANNGTIVFKANGTAYFLIPGQTYQLCEVNLPGGWLTSLSNGGFVPESDLQTFDNSVICQNFAAQAGVTVTFNVNNTPPPEGDARTIGYWKNHASCSGSKGKQDPVTDKTLQAAGDPGIQIGLVDLTDANPDVKVASSCKAAVQLLDKRDTKGAKRASSPLFNLASQLTAAKLNIVANAGSCLLADKAIEDGHDLLGSVGFNGTLTPAAGYPALTSQKAKIANALAGQLDDYNNNELCQ